jgi:nitroreductase
MALSPEIAAHRRADHPIEDVILNRWSPRAMTGEPVSDEELMRLWEAARWAPSSYNDQPWRFIYARRDTPHWDRFFDLLVEANRKWCADAAVLVVIVSRTWYEKNGKPYPTHTFDTGSAWENLAIQGRAMGLVTHGMAGFDWDRAPEVVDLPDGWEVMAMCAIGRHDTSAEETITDRMPAAEIAHEGSFPA